MDEANCMEMLLSRTARLAEANCLVADKNSKTDYHRHANRLHITYVEKGHGQCLVGDVLTGLNPGTLHVVLPNELHQYQANPSDPYTIYFLHFDWTGPAPELPRMTVLKDDSRRRRIHSLFYSLFHIFHYFQGRTKEYRLLALLLELFAELTDMRGDAGQRAEPTYDSSFFMDILTLLQTPPFAFPGIDELANRKNMSRRNFTRLFRNETNLSVMEYFLKARMSHAKHLNSLGGYSQKEIAAQCGYSNTQNFQRAYKSYFVEDSAKDRRVRVSLADEKP